MPKSQTCSLEDIFNQAAQLNTPLSFNVDLLLLILKIKNGLRIALESKDAAETTKAFALKHGYYCSYDSEYHTYIAKKNNFLETLIILDKGITPKKFGLALGYPECCCNKIQTIGEQHIDEFEETLDENKFKDAYRLINPKPYRQGTSLISHIPCNYNCDASLKIAKITFEFIQKNKKINAFQPWLDYWEINL